VLVSGDAQGFCATANAMAETLFGLAEVQVDPAALSALEGAVGTAGTMV
jgi:hypothetical protein